MKILIVSRYCVYPSWQGSAQHARTFAHALITHGNEVHVVSGEDTSCSQEITQDGYLVTTVPMIRNSGKLEELVSAAKIRQDVYTIANKIFDNWKPDVVHIGAFSQLGPFIEIAHERHVPLVAMVHAFDWLCLSKFLIDFNHEPCSGPESIGKCEMCVRYQLSFKRRIASSIYESLKGMRIAPRTKMTEHLDIQQKVSESLAYLEQIRSYIDMFIAQSPMTLDVLVRYGVPRTKICMIPQWLIENKLRRYDKIIRDNSDQRIRIGYVGRLSSEKGLNVLGSALRNITNSSKVELNILSSGASLSLIERYLGPLPFDNIKIRIMGDLQGETSLPKAIAELDVCIVPSTCRETGPRTLLEAIAQGVPCIASDSVGNSYLIQDNVNGRILKAGDVDALALSIQDIIDRPSILHAWRKSLPDIMGENEWIEQMLTLHKDVLDIYGL